MRHEGKRPLGRLRHRWEGKIKMDLRGIRIDGANWIRLAQDGIQWWPFVSTVESRLLFECDGNKVVPALN
jgi:hypothetical protein